MPGFDSAGNELVGVASSIVIPASQSGTWTITPIGDAVIITQSFTRPANTTQYAIGETVTATTAAAMTFSNASRIANWTGNITGAKLIDSAYQVTQGDFDLFLFDTAPSITSDSAAFTPTDAEMATLVGVISFEAKDSKIGNAAIGAGGNVFYEGSLGPNGKNKLLFKTATASTSLYGILVAQSTYTPVASESFTVRLMVERN